MEIDGTYLMQNNERLSFSGGYQVGVTHIINRPTFFLFEDTQSHVLKYLIGKDEQLQIIGHIFDAAQFDIRNSCQSGHSIRSDLVMDDEQFNTLKSFSMNANSLTRCIPRSFHEGHPMNLFGGIWEDENEHVHIDVSSWVQDLDEALELGKKYNQLTIWDWSIMGCRCTKTGEVLEY